MKTSLGQVQCVRFDRNESPLHINEGNGWRDRDVTEWLHGMDLLGDEKVSDSAYIRAKQYPAAGAVTCKEVEIGVVVTECAKLN